MHWMIKCRSKQGTDELRSATIPAHIEHLDKYKEMTWFSGPIFTDDGKSAIGSLRFIEFPDRESAQTYIDKDPYTVEGIFDEIIIKHWQPALNQRQLDYDKKDGTQQFIVHCIDSDKSEGKRDQLRQAHRDYLVNRQEFIIARGPLRDNASGPIVGSALLLDVKDREFAESLLDDEPFNKSGIYEHISVERWFFGHV